MEGIDVSLVVHVRVEHPDLLLVETLEAVPEAEVRLDVQPHADGEEVVEFARVVADDFAAFESAAAGDDAVDDLTFVEDESDGRIYRLTSRTPGPLVTGTVADLGVWIVEIRPEPGAWTLELHVPDRETFVAFKRYCRETDVGVTVLDLRAADRGETGPPELTEPQLKTLLRAYREGYFESPRRITQKELAAELDLSGPAVSYRLRRGVAGLIRHTLLGDGSGDAGEVRDESRGRG